MLWACFARLPVPEVNKTHFTVCIAASFSSGIMFASHLPFLPPFLSPPSFLFSPSLPVSSYSGWLGSRHSPALGSQVLGLQATNDTPVNLSFFESGFHYISLTVLELRLASNRQCWV